MLEAIISSIHDPTDYLTALSLLKKREAPGGEEMVALLGLYEKYLPQAYTEDPGFARMFVAASIFPAAVETAGDYLAPLGLEGNELGVLTMVLELVGKRTAVDARQAQDVIELTRDDSLSPLLRGMLARAELDILVKTDGWLDMREEIVALAEFLSGYDVEQLNRCTELLREVRDRCRQM